MSLAVANEADALGWMLAVHLVLFFSCLAVFAWFFLRLRRLEKRLPPEQQLLKELAEESRMDSRPHTSVAQDGRESWERDPDWWKNQA
jgi:hypothetical protein